MGPMPACPVCDHDNPDGYRFCGSCGVPLTLAECPSCRAVNVVGQAYCGQCGSPMADAPVRGAPSAFEERKLATVLFADVVGFTSLAERTDPELVARMVDGAFRRLGDVVTQHGGTVDKYMGDSVMAVFGVPVAHDDDAERAVAAGLAMRELPGDLAFSIGINSGEVMATAVGSADAVTVIGDTVNVAARLEKAAGPGEVLCGKLTAELAGRRVVFRERQPVLLKGKREPVDVWEALGLRPSEDLGGPAEVSPLIGRDDDLAFLVAQWRRVRADRQSHVVLLCGDAGAGKTRLVNELAQLAAVDGAVVRTNYPAYGATGGVRVAADVVRQLGPAADGEVDARVRAIAGDVDPSLKALDPAGMRQEQLWAFGRLLQEKASERPVLLVIDDMHHSGPRTLELLGDLAGKVTSVAVLTVLVGRSEPDHWLARFPGATTVRLGPLGRTEAAALAGALACDKPLSADAAEFFAARGGGNPLYVRELVAMARTRGALVDEGDCYGLTADASVPATLQALLAARLDALDPGQKLVVQHVAVLGDAAEAEQIVALGVPTDAAALSALVDARLLRRRGDGRYETVDPLLGEVAYETLPRNVRGELHRKAAGLASRPEDRARHLEHAVRYLGDDKALTAEAAEGLAQAGEAFIEASRHLDALRLLERALALGCRRPTALLNLARIQALCGKQDEALETLELVPDDPADPSQAAERDHVAANTRTFSDPAWAVPRLEASAARWRELGNKVKEGWALANAGVASFNLSRMEESAAQLERALALFEEAGDRNGAVSTSSFLCLAKPTDRRVERWLADALEFADEAGDRSKQITTLTTLAWHHFFRSFLGRTEDMGAAEGFAQRMAELAEELGADDMAIQGRSLVVVMARLSGRLAEAQEQVAQLQRVAGGSHHGEPWLGWAASFAVTVATGATGAAPPFPPDTSLDPVIQMAGLIVDFELLLAGRLEEPLTPPDQASRLDLGVIGDLVGVVRALGLVLRGRGGEAGPVLARAEHAAHALDAPFVVRAVEAMRAEVTGDAAGIGPAPADARSVGDALVLRAFARAGSDAAVDALRSAARALGAPGLMTGVVAPDR
jgi:class 3 adenylate cyclase/tetratricopeptide (TPR) repeat protein